MSKSVFTGWLKRLPSALRSPRALMFVVILCGALPLLVAWRVLPRDADNGREPGWFRRNVVEFFFPSSPEARSGRRVTCKNNLKQIGLALHNYIDAHGTFPPAYVADETGRALHSWRVLLLPFLDQDSLYEQYHFDEPWDGPHNRLLADKIIDVFNCPKEDGGTGPSTDTSYVAVVGPRTAWPGTRGRPIGEITDGTSKTWAVVEMRNSGIRWSEPRDLDFNHMSFQINSPIGQAISSRHESGALVLFADGSAHFMAEWMSPDEIRSLLIVDDGKPPEEHGH